MTTIYLWCAIVGGAVLVFQLVAGLFGLEHGHAHDVSHDHGAGEGLNLVSIRSVAAAFAFAGLAGLAARSMGAIVSVVAAVAAGTVAMMAVAAIIKGLGRFERDATLSLDAAVGTTGVVYLSIPGHRSGAGKVHLTVQNRLVEVLAVTAEDPLPTGASVLVVDREGNDTVVVVRNPILLNEVSNVGA